jgi:hypothetical protein
LYKSYNGFNHFEIARIFTKNHSNKLKDFHGHWVQSYYAKKFLDNLGFESKFVGDFLFDENSNINIVEKEDIIVYNPLNIDSNNLVTPIKEEMGDNLLESA